MSRPDEPDDQGAEADEAMVEISASASADELRVQRGARTAVRFRGRGETTVSRQGVPPSGAREGRVYRQVRHALKIRARPRLKGKNS